MFKTRSLIMYLLLVVSFLSIHDHDRLDFLVYTTNLVLSDKQIHNIIYRYNNYCNDTYIIHVQVVKFINNFANIFN